ncbi:LytR/AlgR family response regulator transcription factor [Winogradskyella algicola]|uniref:LytR/AlgR family response regulator transcription factor n=1 Tax=Winogradskyella algicola TaxID=2575815 RepID=UPI00110956E8|nr:response regulator [Winogradskyella algicola]
MNKIRVLIVEDEVIIADNIRDALESLGYDVLEPAINFTEAIETIENEKPDIAILDVQLSGKKTGIDLAQVITDQYKFPFIFLTSNSDELTLNEAKQVSPSAYLVKPFSKRELYTSIEVAIFNHSQKQKTFTNNQIKEDDALFLKIKGVYQKIKFNDILYLQSDHVYILIFLTNSKTILARATLNDMLDKLSKDFIRVHRSFIINSKFLTQISGNTVTVNDSVIPIGKKFRQVILEKINYM